MVWPTESARVWGEVSRSILNKDWGKASEAKRRIEEEERKRQRERERNGGQIWVPKHFSVAHTKDDGWECWPLEQLVPPAPIIVPP